MTDLINASRALRMTAAELSTRATTMLRDAGQPTIERWVGTRNRTSKSVYVDVLRADPDQLLPQRMHLTQLMDDRAAWQVRALGLLESITGSTRSGSLTHRAAVDLSDTVTTLESSTSAFRALIAHRPVPGADGHNVSLIERVVRRPNQTWPSGSDALSSAKIMPKARRAEFPVESVAVPLEHLVARATALDRITHLGAVRAAEDGARALVDAISEVRLTAGQTPSIGAAARNDLVRHVNTAHDHLESARDGIRTLVSSSFVPDGSSATVLPDVYVSGVGTVLAELTGVRDAYHAAAGVLDAADAGAGAVLARRLRAAGTTIDGVAERFGNRHVPAVLEVAAAIDDLAATLRGPWDASAPTFDRLHPLSELPRTRFRGHVQLEHAFSSTQQRHEQLAQEIDGVLGHLGETARLTPPGT